MSSDQTWLKKNTNLCLGLQLPDNDDDDDFFFKLPNRVLHVTGNAFWSRQQYDHSTLIVFHRFTRKCDFHLKVTLLSGTSKGTNLGVLYIHVVAGECNVNTYLCKQVARSMENSSL